MSIDLDSVRETVRRNTSIPVPDLQIMPTGTAVFQLVHVVPAAVLDEAWSLYIEAFEELRVAAAQRHVMFRSEFDEVMSDKRITKILGFDGTTMCALAVETTDLHAVTLISPEYFEARFPQQYAANSIFYVPFFAVRPGYQRSGVLVDLMRIIGTPAAEVGGIIAMDISSSRRARHMDKAVGRAVRNLAPGASTICLDEQSFWAYECAPSS